MCLEFTCVQVHRCLFNLLNLNWVNRDLNKIVSQCKNYPTSMWHSVNIHTLNSKAVPVQPISKWRVFMKAGWQQDQQWEFSFISNRSYWNRAAEGCKRRDAVRPWEGLATLQVAFFIHLFLIPVRSSSETTSLGSWRAFMCQADLLCHDDSLKLILCSDDYYEFITCERSAGSHRRRGEAASHPYIHPSMYASWGVIVVSMLKRTDLQIFLFSSVRRK